MDGEINMSRKISKTEWTMLNEINEELMLKRYLKMVKQSAMEGRKHYDMDANERRKEKGSWLKERIECHVMYEKIGCRGSWINWDKKN